MSGIFGLVRRDGAPVADALATMRAAMPRWGPDGFGEWCERDAALGQARLIATPESRFEDLPAWDGVAGFAFTAAGRLDNRAALVAELGLSPPGPGVGDGGVMMAAYRRWGEDTPGRLLGDWSFAAWHPAQRQLFVARDQMGRTALYYHCDRETVAFCCSQRALLALGLTPIVLDELYLAQYLISWPGYHGHRTATSAARRLAPAHTLTVTPQSVRTSCYWRLEDQAVVSLPARSDYVTVLRQTFDDAVRSRLRATGPVGIMLSGGLDSSAVAATAAEQLRDCGERLTAFTAVPIGPARDDSRVFGDELPLVRTIAHAAGNIDVVPVGASGVSPMDGIRWALEVYGAPIHAAANMFWVLELQRQARAAGVRVLLDGARGNGGISWGGDPLSAPLVGQLRTLGVRRWTARRVRRALPESAWRQLSRRRVNPDWYRASAINPEFAQRLALGQRRLEDPDTRPRTPRDQRLAVLKPGRTIVGSTSAELGGWFGIDSRDPTADARVLAFTMSVPDGIFRSPEDGSSKWLIREAMRGRVPEQVRLNRRKGLQAADLVNRLRACAEDVSTALEELRAGPAAAFVDVDHMGNAWRAIQREDSIETHRLAVSVLTRGIMGGLFANAVVTAAPSISGPD